MLLFPRHSPVAAAIEVEEGRSHSGKIPISPLPRRTRPRTPVKVSYGVVPEIVYTDSGHGTITLTGFGVEAHSRASAATGVLDLLSGHGVGWSWSRAASDALEIAVALEVTDEQWPPREWVLDLGAGNSARVRRLPVRFEVELPDGETRTFEVDAP
jgi:hypothetical protein